MGATVSPELYPTKLLHFTTAARWFSFFSSSSSSTCRALMLQHYLRPVHSDRDYLHSPRPVYSSRHLLLHFTTAARWFSLISFLPPVPVHAEPCCNTLLDRSIPIEPRSSLSTLSSIHLLQSTPSTSLHHRSAMVLFLLVQTSQRLEHPSTCVGEQV